MCTYTYSGVDSDESEDSAGRPATQYARHPLSLSHSHTHTPSLSFFPLSLFSLSLFPLSLSCTLSRTLTCSLSLSLSLFGQTSESLQKALGVL